MPFDGIVTANVSHELNSLLANGKIEKVYQPEKDELHLLIRSNGFNYRLLISASSTFPRIHISSHTKTNPQAPPVFCMLLRKHIKGGKIVKIEQKNFERIIEIQIEAFDELGFPTIKKLIVEIMGKHSNILLVNTETGVIFDCIKKVSFGVNRYRQLLPGKIYIDPPEQNKLNLLDLSKEDFYKSMQNESAATYKLIYTKIQGISPALSRELCFNAHIDDNLESDLLTTKNLNDLWSNTEILIHRLKSQEFSPNIILSKNHANVIDFYSFQLSMYDHLHEHQDYDLISEAMEIFYSRKDSEDRIKQRSSDLKRFVLHYLEKSKNKKSKLLKELTTAKSSDTYRLKGELLTSNIYQMELGMDKIVVSNYYTDPPEELEIALTVNMTPSENAQKYFKKYKKAQNAIIEKNLQIETTNQEIAYFETVLNAIENAQNALDIDEIREELREGSYMKKRRNVSKKKIAISKPLEFISSDQFKILVGRNNKQNDLLTLKIANKNDLWFHTKNIPGSHVIIVSEGANIPEKTIREAAELSAFFSKARLSDNVPVDYVQVKHVKKPNGAKPGMVIYDHYNTIYVTPENHIFKKTLNKK